MVRPGRGRAPAPPGGEGPVALQGLDGAGLAGAVRAEQGEHLAAVGDEGEPVDGHGGAVADDHPVALHRGRRRASGAVRRGPRVVTLPLCRHDRYPTGPRRHRRGQGRPGLAGVDPSEVARAGRARCRPPGPRWGHGTRRAPPSRPSPNRWVRPAGRRRAPAERLADDSRAAGRPERGAERGRRGGPGLRCARHSSTCPTSEPDAADGGRPGRQRGRPDLARQDPVLHRRPAGPPLGDRRRTRPAGHGAWRRAVRPDVPPLPGVRRPSPPGPDLVRPRQPRRRIRGGPPAHPGATATMVPPATSPSSRRRRTTSSGTTCGRSRPWRCLSPRCGVATSWKRLTCRSS